MTEFQSLPKSGSGILSCLFVLAIGVIGCQTPQSTPEYDEIAEREAVRGVLMRQQDAWNNGDIAAFMDDYVKSDTLRFTSGGIVRYGWDTTLERYYTAYPDRAAMGTLEFGDLQIDILSYEWALTFGSWHLERGGDYDDIGGRYTLLMHRDSSGWKVLYDHTSQAD